MHLNRTHQDQKRTQKNKNPRESRIRTQERNHSSRRIGETLVILVRVCLCLCRNVLGIFKFYIQKTNENPILFLLLQRSHTHTKLDFDSALKWWTLNEKVHKTQTKNKQTRNQGKANIQTCFWLETLNPWMHDHDALATPLALVQKKRIYSLWMCICTL